ncbi:Ternary complex factor MIP1, leucine-zipper [Spatholobus suberectus]|nr:Ternary complex factor MIP1, leucine-zipper [Spatholobus suberectus]
MMGEFHFHNVFDTDGDAEAGGYAEPESANSRGHRRSNSASDRNLNFSRGRVLHPLEKDRDESLASPPSVRASTLPSPLHDNLTCMNKKAFSSHRASLEKDVEQLQLRLQQEKSMRILLERTMGRASSTLSPGHRHFAAQSKDLIAEIELLEEEVTSREQHVLAMYRSIFEHCVSRPPSEQNSGVASPAHTKHESRKHPSIISSAFCSSKKFPLRSLQALISNNDLKNRIFGSSYAPLSCGKGKVYFGKTCPDSTKVDEKLSTMEKTPVLRTLKDHLNQCPNRLSEEMVKCMATVYCWLRSATSLNTEKSRSSLLSRSSTHAVRPRHGVGEDRDCSCKSVVEIPWIATRKCHSSHASYAIDNYRVLVEQLERVNISQMECDGQIAFWINVHNALVMHAYLAYGIPQGSLKRLALFHKVVYFFIRLDIVLSLQQIL